MAWSVSGEHAIVNGEVTADHVGARGSCVLGELVTFVVNIRRVLAVVDADGASIAVAGSVSLEKRVGPVSPLAKTYNYC